MTDDSSLTPGGDMSRAADAVICPISGDQATERPSSGEYREYECPVCGTFRISETVLALAPQNPELLQAALEIAKHAAEDGVPTISNIVSG